MVFASLTTGQDRSQPKPFEWPTLLIAVVIYGGFGLVSRYHHELPWWVVALLGGYLVAWHGSLQHEVVHGHPTRWPWLNELLVFPSLWLWMPFELYRETHTTHHTTDQLTDPNSDPESYYVTSSAWQHAPRWKRRLLTCHNTLLGRLVLGPIVAVWVLFYEEARRFGKGDLSHLRYWLVHGLGCCATLAWVLWVCDIRFLEYLALYVYPGISLTLLRSFAEHRAHEDPAKRTAIIESRGLLSLLYFSNNLHVLHHQQPSLPWYRLRSCYQERRRSLLAENGGYRFSGYGALAWRYWLHPKEPVGYPLDTSP